MKRPGWERRLPASPGSRRDACSRLLRHTLCQHLADRQVQVTAPHRFQDEGINPQGSGSLRRHGVTETRIEQDRNVRLDTSQLMGQYLTGHSRHGVVRDDQVKTLRRRTEDIQRLKTACAYDDAVAQVL